nr:c-type cytochrome [Flavobacterium indicum]
MAVILENRTSNEFNQKKTNRILIISSGLLVIVIGFLYFLYWRENKNKEFICGTKMPEIVCGNTSFSEKTKKGKELFNINCAACHKLYMNMTGPALSKIDSTKLWNWMTEKNEKADSTKFSEIKIDYHKIMWSKNFGDEQLTELYEYTKN